MADIENVLTNYAAPLLLNKSSIKLFPTIRDILLLVLFVHAIHL